MTAWLLVADCSPSDVPVGLFSDEAQAWEAMRAATFQDAIASATIGRRRIARFYGYYILRFVAGAPREITARLYA